MLGITDYFVVPFGLLLGATSFEVGLLVAIPHLVSSIVQLFSVRLVRLAGGRLPFLNIATALQASVLIPIAALAIAPKIQFRVGYLILFLIFFRSVGNSIAAAWGSLISDYLPPEKRGYYLGRRSQVIGIAGLIGLAAAGTYLSLMKKISPELGFFFLFLMASFCRFLSNNLMSRMTDVPLHSTPESDFTFWQFIRRYRESNFVKYLIYVSAIMFSAHIAAPFFSVYMIRDLKFSYLSYMMVHFSGVMAGLLAFPIWGKHADLLGNARILKTTSLLVPLVPVLWFLFSNYFVPLILLEFFAGFVWGGFNLCATHFIYDVVTPQKRVRCLSYFNLINGVSIFVGTSLGGYLADRLPTFFGSPLLILFLLSALFRLCAHLFLSRRFHEVRTAVRSISMAVSTSSLILSVIGIRPLSGLSSSWRMPSPPPDVEKRME